MGCSVKIGVILELGIFDLCLFSDLRWSEFVCLLDIVSFLKEIVDRRGCSVWSLPTRQVWQRVCLHRVLCLLLKRYFFKIRCRCNSVIMIAVESVCLHSKGLDLSVTTVVRPWTTSFTVTTILTLSIVESVYKNFCSGLLKDEDDATREMTARTLTQEEIRRNHREKTTIVVCVLLFYTRKSKMKTV